MSTAKSARDQMVTHLEEARTALCNANLQALKLLGVYGWSQQASKTRSQIEAIEALMTLISAIEQDVVLPKPIEDDGTF